MGDIFKSLFPEDKTKNKVNVNSNQRKYLLWLLILALLGMAIMIFGNISSGKNQAQQNITNEKTTPVADDNNITSSLLAMEKEMEKSLQQVLQQIDGVGKVVVNLTLSSSPEYQYAINKKVDKTDINERAQDGSTRLTTEVSEDAQIVMKNMTQGKEEPVIIKEVRPEVIGVMVVAEGASDLLISERISDAVQTLLNIPAHRVTVLPKRR